MSIHSTDPLALAEGPGIMSKVVVLVSGSEASCGHYSSSAVVATPVLLTSSNASEGTCRVRQTSRAGTETDASNGLKRSLLAEDDAPSEFG